MKTLPEILEMLAIWAAEQQTHIGREMALISYLIIGGDYYDQKHS